jgi:hypothetical protein
MSSLCTRSALIQIGQHAFQSSAQAHTFFKYIENVTIAIVHSLQVGACLVPAASRLGTKAAATEDVIESG